jgi:hypothetical protein
MGMRALYALIAERFGTRRAPRRNGKGGERGTRRRAAAGS